MQNTIILKLLGLYREPNETKKEEAKVKPVRKTLVPESYIRRYPYNDLNKINKNYQIILTYE